MRVRGGLWCCDAVMLWWSDGVKFVVLCSLFIVCCYLLLVSGYLFLVAGRNAVEVPRGLRDSLFFVCCLLLLVSDYLLLVSGCKPERKGGLVLAAGILV